MPLPKIIPPKITPLYIYGSENPKDRLKVHFADENGRTLCKRTCKWGEVCLEVKGFSEGLVWTVPFIGGRGAMAFPSDIWELNKCSRCEKIYNALPVKEQSS